MVLIWSQVPLPPMVRSQVLAIVPVEPETLLRNAPSTYIVTEVAVRSHRTVCQPPSFSGVCDPAVRRSPFEPWNRHLTIPFGASNFQ